MTLNIGGDVLDHVYRQLATSVGAGTRAALSAERALAALELETAAV